MKNIKISVSVLLLLAFTGCMNKNHEIRQGPWLGLITIDSTDTAMVLPFNMNYIQGDSGHMQMVVSNGDEKIIISEIKRSGDTVTLAFPIFTSEIIAVLKGDSMVGSYYPKGKVNGNAYAFKAIAGITDRYSRFRAPAEVNVTGRWKVVENPGTPDSSVMVGEFRQDSNRVTGTFLNTGGDYRYLQGKVSGRDLYLSAVDGAHTFVFTAELPNDSTIVNGRFMGSPKWKSTWAGKKSQNATLPPADQLVSVKKGSKPFSFAFPDINGDTVRFSDARFRNKVVIVQVAGSWCPNCMDEALFYKDFYTKYKDRGLEIVALCFEDPGYETSVKKMERFKRQTGAGYTFLYAGPRTRANRDSVLYMLEGQVAYPTTIFFDRKGQIRKVETGFSGPGTGEHYRQFASETNGFVEQLLAE